jgi:hypothetical protein
VCVLRLQLGQTRQAKIQSQLSAVCLHDARLLVLLHWTRHSRASVSFPLACLLSSCFVQEKALLSVFLCMVLCQSTSFL